MKTMYCRLRKSTEHCSDANIKHIRILLVGKDFSYSSTKNDNFINRGGLWKVSAGVFEKYFICKCFSQKRETQAFVDSNSFFLLPWQRLLGGKQTAKAV